MGTIYRNGKFYGSFKEDQEIPKEVQEVEALPTDGVKDTLYIYDQKPYYWDGEKYIQLSNEVEITPINAEENEILIGDGNNWAKGSNIKTSTVEYLDYAASFDEANPFTEFRIGPDVIDENSEVSPVATVITNSPCYQKDITSNPLNLPKKASTNQYTLAEKAHRLLIKDTADISFRGNSYVDVQDNARFTMNQNAKLDITGNKAKGLSPQVFIHDNSKLYMESAPYNDMGEYYSPLIHMHGNSRFSMESKTHSVKTGFGTYDSVSTITSPSVAEFSGCYVHMGIGESYNASWAAGQRDIRFNSEFRVGKWSDINDDIPNGQVYGPVVHLTGHPILNMTGVSALALRQNSLIKMDDYSMISMHGDTSSSLCPYGPSFEMGKTSFLALKSQYERSPFVIFDGAVRFIASSDENKYGPSVRINNEQILIHSNLENAGTSVDDVKPELNTILGNEMSLYTNFEKGLKEDWYTPDVNDYVVLDIGGKSRISVGGGTSSPFGIVDVKIGPTSSTWPKAYQEYFKAILGGNTFIQTTGNPHIEMHNGTTLISRGPLLNGKKPWEDYYMDSKRNSLNKLWSTKTSEFITDVELGQRPIKPNVSDKITDERGPLVGLYDEPIVHIHGKWDMSDPDYTAIPSIGFSTSNYPSTVEQLRTNQDYINKCEGLGYTEENYYDDSNISFEMTYNGGYFREYKVTGAKWKPDAKPKDWKERPDKVVDNPYIEIIDNAEIHMSGSGAITINDEGVTFGNASGSVTFSIEELTALKNLLNS